MRIFELKSQEDAVQRNPHWIAIVFPFKNRQTFDQFLLKKIEIKNPVEIDTPILLTSEIQGFSTSGSMEAPTGSLSLSMNASFSEKVDGMGPEDWIVFWALDNKKDFDYIKSQLQQKISEKSFAQPSGKRLNRFEIAPKFVGQVSAIIKNEQLDSSGAIFVEFQLQCFSFNYFQSKQYFDQEKFNLLGVEATRWWSNFTEVEALSKSAPAGLISCQEAIWRILIITLGVGVSENVLLDPTASISKKYLIPRELYDLFRGGAQETAPELIRDRFGPPKFATSTPAPEPTAIDLSNFWFGVQKYAVDFINEFQVFVPSNLKIDPIQGTRTFFETQQPLAGQTLVKPLLFNNNTVWDIVSEYLNRPINEIYSTLKVDRDGNVYPTTIVREITKGLFPQKDRVRFSTSTGLPLDLNVIQEPTIDSDTSTMYSEVPCWSISSNLVTLKNIVLSGTSRINYSQLTPINWFRGDQQRNAVNANLANPIVDDVDIYRNGLQSLISTIPVVWGNDSINNLERKNSFFNNLMASTAFNNHLKLSGQIELLGVQLPISHGDTVMVDGVTYFIERVIHSGGIQGSGIKDFKTVLQVSDGVIVEKEGVYKYPKLSTNRHSVAKE